MGSFKLLTCPGDSITFNLYTLNMIESVFGGHPLACNNMYLLCHMTCLQKWSYYIVYIYLLFILVCFVEVHFATLEAAGDMQVAGCNNYI